MTVGEPTAWLGIDLGTSGCRVVAVSDGGRLLAASERPLSGAHPRPGWHEQDPRSWTDAAAGAIREILGRLSGSEQVGGLAICGTSGTMLLANSAGAPLTPALMYDDARAAGTDQTAGVIDAWAACGADNGYQVQPTWALPKLVWLLDADERNRDARVCFCGDYIGGWLAGHAVASDTSHALKAGYDLVHERWPEPALEVAGIPASMLPPVVRPGTVVGRVGATASAETGLRAGTPIVAGMTDGCASQIASGTVRAGQWNCALGTTFVLKGVSDDLLRGAALYSHRHPDGGWLPGGASSSGAGVLTSQFPQRDLASLDRAATAYSPTSVIRYPLSRPGERFPFVRPDAEPFQLGVPRDDAERFASLLQGVAFVERLSVDYVAFLGADVGGRFAVTGGATKSQYWNQMRADVLGRAVAIPEHPDAAFGMAVVAAASGGTVADMAESMVVAQEVIDPRPEQTRRYLDVYQRMVDELERRGYIDSGLSHRARAA